MQSAASREHLDRREAPRLGRLRTPERQPESGLPPAAQPRLPLCALVRHLAEADLSLSESRLREPCFLTCLFFSSWRWDTLFAPVGHPARRRQEAAGDDIGIDAARAPPTRDDALLGQFGQMAGDRAPGLSRG